MSRVGKKPIPLPQGVKIAIGEKLEVQGPKGKLTVPSPPGIRAEQKNNHLEFVRDDDKLAAMHGLTRALAANAVQGVSTGFTRELDIVGVGYRAEVKGNQVQFALGYSHPVLYDIPEGIKIEIDAKANRVTVTGADRQKVGQVAAEIRGFRGPEPYKGKGIRYTTEQIRRKEGKKK